jgi:hypothetical protein
MAVVNKRHLNDVNYGYIDPTGEIIPLQYDDAFDFRGGLAAVVKDGKFGFIDKKGQNVIPHKFDNERDDQENYYFKDGLVKISLEGKYGYWNDQGKEAVKPQYDYLGDFSENLAVARQDYQFGYINQKGQVAVRFKYQDAQPFSEGLAAVMLDGLWGFIAKPTSQAAAPTNSKITIDGKKVDLEAYNIKGSNYFKLRDIAMLMKDTEKHFSISLDSDKNGILLNSEGIYTPVGGELKRSSKLTAKSAQPSVSIIYLNGSEIELTAYNIAGSNYFKLVDLGKTLNFQVDWNAATKTILLNTSKAFK